MGLEKLSDSLSSDQKKKSKVNLNTFHTKSEILKKPKEKVKVSGISNEISALLCITQIQASGGQMNLNDFIGKHECSDFPPSRFEEDGKMRSGTKANLLKVLKEETKVTTTPQLPEDDSRVSVVVDAMYLIRCWSFLKGESFRAIAYKYLLLSDIPINTHSIHFCCDRYSVNLKEAEQEKRYLKSKVTKVYVSTFT